MDLKQRKSALEAEIRALATKARTEQGGHFTPDQHTIVTAKLDELETVKARIKEADESAALMGAITALRPDADDGDERGEKARVSRVGYLSFKGLADSVKAIKSRQGFAYNVKALVGVGSDITTPEVTTQSIVEMDRPATSLLDVLPVKVLENGDQWTYLRQVARTNNAAPVAVGGLKPTSEYTIERVTGKLEVIAHISEPIHEYWLADESSLSGFISDEMGYGLQTTVEAQALTGDGTSPNLRGLLNVSGIQTQAFTTSAIRTVRSAITKVENLGKVATAVVLNPLDWEAIETSTTSTGEYLLDPNGTPIDRKARRLWGVPVVVSAAVTQGTGVLFSAGSVILVTDGRVELAWGRITDDFARNQIRARAEGRFGLEVARPNGIVKLTLTGA